MAKTIKVVRAGTVLFVDEKKLDFFLSHGYERVQPEKTPAHLKPPLYKETETPAPAVIKVQLVEDSPEWDESIKPEQPIQPFEVPAKVVKSKKAGQGEAIQADESAGLPPVKQRKVTRKKKADK